MCFQLCIEYLHGLKTLLKLGIICKVCHVLFLLMLNQDDLVLEINYEASAKYVSEKIDNQTFFDVFETLEKVLLTLKFAKLSPKEAIYILNESKNIYSKDDVFEIFSYLLVTFHDDYDQCIEFLDKSYAILQMKPIESLINIINKSRDASINKENIIKQLQEEIVRNRKDIEQLSEKSSRLIYERFHQNGNLNNQIEELNREVVRLNNGKNSLINRINNLKTDKNKLTNEKNDLKNQNRELRIRCGKEPEKNDHRNNNNNGNNHYRDNNNDLYIFINFFISIIDIFKSPRENINDLNLSIRKYNELVCSLFAMFVCGCIKGFLGIFSHEIKPYNFDYALGISFGYLISPFLFLQPNKYLIFVALCNIINLLLVNFDNLITMVMTTEGIILALIASTCERVISRKYYKKLVFGVVSQVFGQYVISKIFFATSNFKNCAYFIILLSLIFVLILFVIQLPSIHINFEHLDVLVFYLILFVIMANTGAELYKLHFIYDSKNSSTCFVYLIFSVVSMIIKCCAADEYLDITQILFSLFLCLISNAFSIAGNVNIPIYFMCHGLGMDRSLNLVLDNHQDYFIMQCIYWLISYKRFSLLTNPQFGMNEFVLFSCCIMYLVTILILSFVDCQFEERIFTLFVIIFICVLINLIDIALEFENIEQKLHRFLSVMTLFDLRSVINVILKFI